MMVASANFLALISAMITLYTIVSSPSLHNNVPEPKVLQEHFIKVKFNISIIYQHTSNTQNNAVKVKIKLL